MMPLIFVFFLISCVIADPYLPGHGANLKIVRAGSLIIATDNVNQGISGVYNLKTYGLLIHLLNNQIPIWWAINSAKTTKEGTDFIVNVSKHYPVGTRSTAITSKVFTGGPFIIPWTYATQADPFITAFGNNINIWKLANDTTIDIRFQLTHKIKVGVLDDGGNAAIHTAYMIEAGIATSGYTVVTSAELINFNSGTCYSVATEPHVDTITSTVANNVRTFLQAGRNVLAQCAGVRAFEGAGLYQTTGGVIDANTASATTSVYGTVPVTQYIGDVWSNVGGSLSDWSFSGARANTYGLVKATTGNQYMVSIGKLTALESKGGAIVYIGGHSYVFGSSKSPPPEVTRVNSIRTYFNTIMMPAVTPNACNFNQYFPPTLVNDTVSTLEDTPVTIDILINDFDPVYELTMSMVNITIQPSLGTLTKGTQNVTYTPAADRAGTYTAVYLVCNSDNQCGSAGITIIVISVLEPPTAVNDTTITPENIAISVNITANDFDPDTINDPTDRIDISTLNITIQPTRGLATISLGVITYTPSAYLNGLDLLTYRICDTTARCSTAILFITVTPVNQPPLLQPDTAVVPEDSNVLINVLSNDVDTDGDANYTSLAIIVSPINGNVTKEGNNTRYTPNTDFCGTDTFRYILCDTSNLCSNTTVTVTVTCVADPPVIIDNHVSTFANQLLMINQFANDYDVDNNLNVSTIQILTPPVNGNFSFVPNVYFINYNPNPFFYGNDSIIYRVCDTTNLCGQATIFITILQILYPPIVVDDIISTPENTPVIISVLINDFDQDNNLNISSLSVSVSPLSGNVTVTSNGSLYYVPQPFANGNLTFTYMICDTSNLCGNGTVYVIITDVDQPPIAMNDSYVMNEDTILYLDVLANDYDLDDNVTALNFTIVLFTSNGVLSFHNFTHTVAYSPFADFNGIDRFGYGICDANMCSYANVTITVLPVPDPPVALDDYAILLADTNITVNVAQNDSDVDGDLLSLSVVISTPPTHAQVYVDPQTGFIHYVPNLYFYGSDSVVYTISDNTSYVSSAVLHIIVLFVPHPPQLQNDSYTILEDSTNNLFYPLLNDGDPDGDLDPSTLTIVSFQNGVGSVLPNATLLFTPTLHFYGITHILYSVCDNTSLCRDAYITVTVQDIEHPPVAYNDYAEVLENYDVFIDVLFNDTDVDNNIDPNQILIVQPPSVGFVSIFINNTVRYFGGPFYNGNTTFSYKVCDTTSLCSNVAQVFVTVIAVPTWPVALDDFVTTLEGQRTEPFNILSNDIFIDYPSNTSGIIITSYPTHGIINETNGVYVYTPDPFYYGVDQFTYHVCDTINLCDTATVYIFIMFVANRPITVNDTTIVNATQSINIPVLINDTDYDNDIDPLSLAIYAYPSEGILTITNGTVLYQSNSQSFYGVDSFSYVICDAYLLCEIGYVEVNVLGVMQCVDDTYALPFNDTHTLNVLLNDIAGFYPIDNTTLSIITPPNNGTAFVQDGFIIFTSDPGFYLTDSLVYEACDTGGFCDQATINLIITNFPYAIDDYITILAGKWTIINVTVNDYDLDNDLIFGNVTLISPPSFGNAMVFSNDTIFYNSSINQGGNTTLIYMICDLEGFCDHANVFIHVIDIPVAMDDYGNTTICHPVTINILSNDFDMDNDFDYFSFNLNVAPSGGYLNIANFPNITYYPYPYYSGVDVFEYRICDIDGQQCDNANVTIFVLNDTNFEDCNSNCLHDVDFEITNNASLDCNSNQVLDECELSLAVDCNQNQVLDECELIENDCDSNGLIDECEIFDDCNSNAVKDVCDLNSGWSSDCNNNTIPDECDIAANTSFDCNGNLIPDNCDIESNLETDYNSNGLPDICDPLIDCNLNGINDFIDIATFTSLDCDNNTIPDECDIFEDCNENEINDICDLFSGWSSDCNGNTIPDECDIASNVTIDCNLNYVPDDCDIQQGIEYDLNNNGIPDVCDFPIDCNNNSLNDLLDILMEFSVDCDNNSIPDECDNFTDCNANGVNDLCDISFGWSSDCNNNTNPDDCDIATNSSLDCNGNNIPDECDIQMGIEQDVDNNGVPDICGPPLDCNENAIDDLVDIASMFSMDCNNNSIPDECDLNNYTSLDCDNNTIPDECDNFTDCNGNGINDLCDIFSGNSSDCNDNVIPDECDIFNNFANDCNLNGIPDNCDIQFGNSTDCDIDGVPDECESDCNENSIPDPCDISLGTSIDCNGNGMPDDCENDCDGNGIIDPCEIMFEGIGDCDGDGLPNNCEPDCNSDGLSDSCSIIFGNDTDCNGNAIPDSCETDCNGNLIPDTCDLMTNYSMDMNHNAIPDECEIPPTTGVTTTALPTTAEPTTGVPTTAMPTTAEATTGIPTTAELTTAQPTTAEPTTEIPTTSEPTTAEPTTAELTTGIPTTSEPTTAVPTTTILTTAIPTTAEPTTAIPTTAVPTTAEATTAEPTTGMPTTSEPTTAVSTTAIASTAEPTTGVPTTPEPTSTEPTTAESTTAIPTTVEPTTGIPTTAQSTTAEATTALPTTAELTTIVPTTAELTTAEATTAEATTGIPTTAEPTTGIPTTAEPTTAVPTTSEPTTALPTTAQPTTTVSTTAELTTALPTTAEPTTAIPTTAEATTVGVTTAQPTTAEVTTGMITTTEFTTGLATTGIITTTAPIVDCNFNGIDDFIDISTFFSVDCDSNTIPDECDNSTDCNANGINDACDISSGWSSDCNGNTIPDECDIASNISADCNGNYIPDDCDIQLGIEIDSNHNNIPDVCESFVDCNENGIEDLDDIASTFSLDCDNNYVPDECDNFTDCNTNGINDVCDIDSGWSLDCNNNTRPDECDIATNSSLDCNRNGFLDECDIQFGIESDLNNNTVPDVCEPVIDCNLNGIDDLIDIANEASLDCNDNTIPDECDDFTNCNENGINDLCDINSGWSSDCNGNSIPDECDILNETSLDCNGNSNPDDCDLQLGIETDVNGNGVPDVCEIVNDCNGNNVEDQFDIILGSSLDCNFNMIPDGCEPDCDNNSIPDSCDISMGTYNDCDADGVPDICENDCNHNGLEDHCDIFNLTSMDCDANGIPDECEIDCNSNGRADSCDIAFHNSTDCNGNGIPDECDGYHCPAPTTAIPTATQATTSVSTTGQFTTTVATTAMSTTAVPTTAMASTAIGTTAPTNAVVTTAVVTTTTATTSVPTSAIATTAMGTTGETEPQEVIMNGIPNILVSLPFVITIGIVLLLGSCICCLWCIGCFLDDDCDEDYCDIKNLPKGMSRQECERRRRIRKLKNCLFWFLPFSFMDTSRGGHTRVPTVDKNSNRKVNKKVNTGHTGEIKLINKPLNINTRNYKGIDLFPSVKIKRM